MQLISFQERYLYVYKYVYLGITQAIKFILKEVDITRNTLCLQIYLLAK